MIQKMEAISSSIGMYLTIDDEYHIHISIPEEITLEILFKSEEKYND
ncbi:MAG: hypothetical protein JWN78_400 [Bacteroidota bacterium]|nr:hypothetical protein [Bacteroidota bacterium]